MITVLSFNGVFKAEVHLNSLPSKPDKSLGKIIELPHVIPVAEPPQKLKYSLVISLGNKTLLFSF